MATMEQVLRVLAATTSTRKATKLHCDYCGVLTDDRRAYIAHHTVYCVACAREYAYTETHDTEE